MSPILTASRKIPAMQTMRIIITGVSSPVAAAPLAAPSSPPGTTGIKSKNRILQLMYGKCFKILNTFPLKFSIRARIHKMLARIANRAKIKKNTCHNSKQGRP